MVFNVKYLGEGQGHKNWCGVEYGEEDIDWQMIYIPGLGMRVMALRDLPPLYRLIVDRDLNAYQCVNMRGICAEKANCMYKRCSVFPHDCDANAVSWSMHEKGFEVRCSGLKTCVKLCSLIPNASL